MNLKRAILWCGLLSLMAAGGLARADDVLESQLSARLNRAAYLSSRAAKQDEIVAGHVVYSGIVVEAVKSDNLLQLFNPFASVNYATTQDNTIPDPRTGRARGWKLFSLQF